MGVAMELWRELGNTVVLVRPSPIALEDLLESYIEYEASMLGQKLLIIGRQVTTGSGGRIDLLAIDEDGVIHVIEIKRGETPSDVITQLLSYGHWVNGLSRAQLVRIYAKYVKRAKTSNAVTLDDAFYGQFDRMLPDEINTTQVYTIVAASLDPSTERAVRLLAELNVPIKVALFQRFPDPGGDYYARAWLVEPEGRARATATNPVKAQPPEAETNDASVSVEEHGFLTAPVNRGKEPLHSCLVEPHPHLGKLCTWSAADGALESAPAVSIRRRHHTELSDSDRQLKYFWHAFATRFVWDFLPGSFLYALWVYWLSSGEATDLSQIVLTKPTFARRLMTVATASGEWAPSRSRPGSMMDADEPLTDLVPHWAQDDSNAAIRGLRRIGTIRSSSDLRH